MERLLGATRDLSEKVTSNESAAGELLRQCESLQQELKAMRQVSGDRRAGVEKKCPLETPALRLSDGYGMLCSHVTDLGGYR